MKIIFIDLETFNPEPKAINNGAAKYSERAEIILISYAIGAEPARVVDVSNGEPMPEDLYALSLRVWLTFPTASLCQRISMRH